MTFTFAPRKRDVPPWTPEHDAAVRVSLLLIVGLAGYLCGELVWRLW